MLRFGRYMRDDPLIRALVAQTPAQQRHIEAWPAPTELVPICRSICMAQGNNWRTNLTRVLDAWDDAINGKAGLPDDQSDRPVIRTKLSSIVKRSGRAHRSSDFDAALVQGLEE